MGFKVGEKVVYPNHGIGIIEDVCERELGAETSRFYMLRLKATDSVVMVPVANAEILAERIPRAELRILDEAGHLYSTEQPEVEEEIARFFEGAA